MLGIDVKSLDKDQAERMLAATNIVMEHMQGDSLNVSVDMILNDEFPEIVQESIKELNIGVAANGFLFDNDKQGFMSYLMEEMYGNRKVMKGNMIQSQQNVEDIKQEIKQRGIEK